MRVSPVSYHVVPRAWSWCGCGAADEHETGPGCPIRCLDTVIPARVLDRVVLALSQESASPRPVTVADVLSQYRSGELASLPGIGPRRFAAVERGLFIAGLITRRDRPARRLSGKAASR